MIERNTVMKTSAVVVCLCLLPFTIFNLTAANSTLAGKERNQSGDRILGIPNRTKLNINQVSSWYDDDGRQEHNSGLANSGLTFPRQTATAVYEAGLIWGGIFNDGLSPQIRVNGQSYNSGTQRGAILGVRTGVAEDPDAPDVRIWRVRRDYYTADLTLDAAEIFEVPPGSVTQEQIQAVKDQYASDWAEWPAAKGAPFYDSDGDGIYTPEFVNGVPTPYPDADEPGLADADQVIWYVCNDLTSQPWTDVQSGIELQTTLWGYAETDALGNAIFKRFRLIYKGTAETADNASIDDMYLCQWSDPDVGDFGDDYSGCDTVLSLGFAYNGVATDAAYAAFGLAPPSVGYDLLQGPVVYTGVQSDTAVFDFRKISGARNLVESSFIYFAAGGFYSDPPFTSDGGIQWYQMLRGLPPTPQGPPDPPPPTDPYTGQPAGHFWLYAGSDGSSAPDPANPNGWVDGIIDAPGDRRILVTSGPFNLALGDTEEIVVATVLGISTSYLESVETLKFNDNLVQDFYNDLVGFVPGATSVDEQGPLLPVSPILYQNYPNPFNPVTHFGFEISNFGFVSLKIFDLLGREVASLVNEKLGPGTYTRQWDATGFASGVYFFRLQTGSFLETKKLVLLR
jgi:hypothetical protein